MLPDNKTDTSREAVEKAISFLRSVARGPSWEDFILPAEQFTELHDCADLIEVLQARAERAEAGLASPIATLLPDAIAAAEKAMNKFPQPNYVITKWAEETGEVTKSLVHMAEGRETPESLRGELVQSLAMLHRLMMEGDQVHGLSPIAPTLAQLDAEPAGVSEPVGVRVKQQERQEADEWAQAVVADIREADDPNLYTACLVRALEGFLL